MISPFQMNRPKSNCEALKPLQTDQEETHTTFFSKFLALDGGAIDADREACDFTAYRLRLLIKGESRGCALLGEMTEEGRKGQKGGKRRSLCCRAAAQCNQAIKPLFQRKLSPSFFLKTRGVKELQLPTEVRQCLKPRWTGFKGTDNKKTSFTHKGKDASARRQEHSRAGEHSGFLIPALSAPWHHRGQRANHEAGAQRQARSKKHMR